MIPHQYFELVSAGYVTKRATIAGARQSGILSALRVFKGRAH